MWRLMTCVALIGAGVSIYLGARLFSTIQGERERNIRDGCVASNDRNRDTKITYNRQIVARFDSKAAAERLKPWQVDGRTRVVLRSLPDVRRREIEQGRSFTYLLIDKLSPVRDCGLVVESQVRTGK